MNQQQENLVSFRRAAKATAVTVGVLLYAVACATTSWVGIASLAVMALGTLWSVVYTLSEG